jgi:predicted lipid-binding transport protein (Tim44 family)
VTSAPDHLTVPAGPPVPPPTHPKASLALWLGVVGLGTSFLAVPLVLGPFAWFYGARARREIAAAPSQWSGSGEATAGLVLGIVNTVLLVIGLFALAGVVMLVLVFGVIGSQPGH